MKFLFTIMAACFLAGSALAQSNGKVELTLHMATSSAQEVSEKENKSWLAKIKSNLEGVFATETNQYELLVNVKLSESARPILVPHLKPCNDALLQQINKAMESLPDMHCKKGTMTFDLFYTAKGTIRNVEALAFCPPLNFKNPFENAAAVDDYERLSLLSKKMQALARTNIVSMKKTIAGYPVGLKNTHKWLTQIDTITDFTLPVILENIEYNLSYWNALEENQPDAFALPVLMTNMLVASGEFSRAIHFWNLFAIQKKESPSLTMSMPIISLANEFDKLHDNILEKGTGYHDKGEYKKALEVYANVLKVFPKSSRAMYETYFTENYKYLISEKEEDVAIAEKNWRASETMIYARDPMYSTGVFRKDQIEAFIVHQRMSLRNIKMVDNESMFMYSRIGYDLSYSFLAANTFSLVSKLESKMKYKDIALRSWFAYSKTQVNFENASPPDKSMQPDFDKILEIRKVAFREFLKQK